MRAYQEGFVTAVVVVKNHPVHHVFLKCHVVYRNFYGTLQATGGIENTVNNKLPYFVLQLT